MPVIKRVRIQLFSYISNIQPRLAVAALLSFFPYQFRKLIKTCKTHVKHVFYD
jgi:hypothetical protein